MNDALVDLSADVPKEGLDHWVTPVLEAANRVDRPIAEEHATT